MKIFILVLLMILPIISAIAEDKPKDSEIQNRRITSKEKLDKNLILPKLNISEIPENLHDVKKLVDLVNVIIEKFNADQMQDLVEILKKTFVEEERAWKAQVDIQSYQPCFLMNYNGYGDEFIIAVFATNNNVSNQIYFNIIAFIEVKNGKVVSATSVCYPGINENTAMKLVITEKETQLMTFPKPTPWIKWTEEGAVSENVMKLVSGKDYIDVMAIMNSIIGSLKSGERR